ncbi:MAG: undecaprenyl-diphosphate phosphatase [Parcubacteria group bacterium]|nr:undecaprenyl-diphosphate phosphatase [Parcubacteria group bacterium]
MFESIVLGTVQGITEWLPISSEGAITFLEMTFFKNLGSLSNIIQFALFLHLGTVLAAVLYFWKDVKRLTQSIFFYDPNNPHTKGELRFLALATFLSGILGFAILRGVIYFERFVPVVAEGFTVALGLFLIATGVIQIRARHIGYSKKDSAALSWKDDILLGIAQGLAVLPGLSRSGLTVSALLMRGFEDTEALRLSMLLSIPIVLLGNIFLNINNFVFTGTAMVGLLFSFLFGLATIHALLSFARRIPWGPFAIFFGVLVLVSAFFGA